MAHGDHPSGATAARIRRQFVQAAGAPSGTFDISSTFRVLQWNLLADGLAQNGDFTRVRPEVLEWGYRKPLILTEVAQAQADVLCFQELNYFEELAAELARSGGYKGAFFAKQRSAALKYSSPADGIAIFWRPDRFQAHSEPQGFYYVDGSGAQYPQGCMHLLLVDKACASAPQPTGGSPGNPERQLLVATTHLKAKEGTDLEQIRLEQVQQLLGHVRDATQAAAATSAAAANGAACSLPHASFPTLPVVVAGDLNTVPGSAPCQALASPPWGLQSVWNVPLRHEEAQHQGGSGNGEAAQEARRAVGEFSTWKFRSGGESKRIIDHVWFTPGPPGGLRVTQRWRMLDEQDIGPDGLPCSSYPSDHLALCTEFAWL